MEIRRYDVKDHVYSRLFVLFEGFLGISFQEVLRKQTKFVIKQRCLLELKHATDKTEYYSLLIVYDKKIMMSST